MKFIQGFTIMEEDRMKIAVLSGKGGTGKTLVSVNLAAAANDSVYIDCDVEEPNGHLFLKPQIHETENVIAAIPYVNEELCNGCRECVQFCNFNAMAYINNKLMIFDDVCHSCGGCVLVCPQKALSEKEKIIGTVQKGTSEDVTVITGTMNIGEESGTAIIKKLLSYDKDNENKLTFIDCPPGSACTVMDSIKDADYCILVAEPTIFGAHNLSMVYELVKLFKKPHGVVLNKTINNENPSEEFCKEHDIKILCKIPYDEELGRLNSDSMISARVNEKYEKLFSSLLNTVIKEARHETAIDS